MRDRELYRTILGFTPAWTVVKLDVSVEEQETPVTAGPGACPRAGHTPRRLYIPRLGESAARGQRGHRDHHDNPQWRIGVHPGSAARQHDSAARGAVSPGAYLVRVNGVEKRFRV